MAIIEMGVKLISRDSVNFHHFQKRFELGGFPRPEMKSTMWDGTTSGLSRKTRLYR